MSTGQLRPADGRWQIVFTPRLAHPPEQVWTALTDPDWLPAWFPNEMHGDRAEGAPLRFTFAGKGDKGAFDGQMRTWDPPRTLAFRWGEDELRFELRADGAGTVLTLIDTIDDVSRAARDAAGWHECLDRLHVALEGQDPDFARDERRAQLHPVYVQEFQPHLATAGPAGSVRRNAPGGAAGEPEPLTSQPLHEDGAGVTPWSDARTRLVAARTYWLATVLPDARPHVMPVPGVWMDGSLYLITSQSSAEAGNLVRDPRCVVTVSSLDVPALELVVEGEAVSVSDEAALRDLAEAYESKYARQTTIRNGAFHGDGAPTTGPPPYAVFAVTPTTVVGLPGTAGTGEDDAHEQGAFHATRWCFTP